jgi:porin
MKLSDRQSRYGLAAVPLVLVIATAIMTGPGYADEAPSQAGSISIRETAEIRDNASGGVKTGVVGLSKLQLSGTFQGDQAGLPGFVAHAEIFRVDSGHLSDRIGDVQTVSNIEAGRFTRLFEAWIEKKFGNDESSLAFRGGLLDLNADFDSIDAAGLFINSSHGIGPDISRSGANGPSIFPVSAAALRVSWEPNKAWTVRGAVFDGVAGDPRRPSAFVRVGLRRADGELTIGQIDYHLSEASNLEVGGWRYSAPLPAIGRGQSSVGHDRGIYASLTGPVAFAKGWTAWVRAGAANDTAQVVDGYLGGGIVRKGLFGRPDDLLGFAIARAYIGPAAQKTQNLPRAETNIEATYQLKANDRFALQPDIQYVVDPAGRSGARNALVFGLRVVITAGYPRQASPEKASDPTVPADGPQHANGGPR